LQLRLVRLLIKSVLEVEVEITCDFFGYSTNILFTFWPCAENKMSQLGTIRKRKNVKEPDKSSELSID
jgi:hypothetical protein